MSTISYKNIGDTIEQLNVIPPTDLTVRDLMIWLQGYRRSQKDIKGLLVELYREESEHEGMAI